MSQAGPPLLEPWAPRWGPRPARQQAGRRAQLTGHAPRKHASSPPRFLQSSCTARFQALPCPSATCAGAAAGLGSLRTLWRRSRREPAAAGLPAGCRGLGFREVAALLPWQLPREAVRDARANMLVARLRWSGCSSSTVTLQHQGGRGTVHRGRKSREGKCLRTFTAASSALLDGREGIQRCILSPCNITRSFQPHAQQDCQRSDLDQTWCKRSCMYWPLIGAPACRRVVFSRRFIVVLWICFSTLDPPKPTYRQTRDFKRASQAWSAVQPVASSDQIHALLRSRATP